MCNPTIGLLPMYIELYDKSWIEMRLRINEFRDTIVSELKKRNLNVEIAPVCRLKSEFAQAVKSFEETNVDAMVTLHLAYSPSLESSDILAATRLPVIVLDTTPTYEFGPGQNTDEILYNHGIHGVQDMCNLLNRSKKKFFIEVGHWEKSDVLNRIAMWAQAAKLASNMQNSRVGRIGNVFKGMGDFDVSPDILRCSIGIETISADSESIKHIVNDISNSDIDDEMAKNSINCICEGLNAMVHRNTVISSLIIRRWIEKEKLTAFTINFLDVDKRSGLPVMPFLEASKAMARGTGYAGEGDVLTAALVGALMSIYPDTSFTEMFCPDWKNNRIFLSHMGEMNLNLAAGKPRLMEKDFPFTDAGNPAAAYARFREGKAVIVNLAPCADDGFALIISRVNVLDVDDEDRMHNSIRGWVEPEISVSDFLKQYSMAGGTHHIVLTYGDVAEVVVMFGRIMGWKVVEI